MWNMYLLYILEPWVPMIPHKNQSQALKYVFFFSQKPHLDVSENSGTPKSSILIGFSSINHPFWGTPIFGNTHFLPLLFVVSSALRSAWKAQVLPCHSSRQSRAGRRTTWRKDPQRGCFFRLLDCLIGHLKPWQPYLLKLGKNDKDHSKTACFLWFKKETYDLIDHETDIHFGGILF